VFSALAALLARKSAADAEMLWFWLEQWISGVASHPPAIPRQTFSPASLQVSGPRAFEVIAHGFEESDSFMRLLNALVVPRAEEDGFSDEIAFPANLGSPYRQPGIHSYVDFALGKTFTEKSVKLSDRYQGPILRLNCLNFICTCLSSFNENLVIIANRSGMAVEEAMNVPSLEAYIKLHPFGRIMEWLFDSKCLDALFSAAQQDVEKINEHDAVSPLVLALVRAIETMIFVMNLQPTYVDVVRPVLRKQANWKPVTHSPVVSFEDAVLKHLDLIVNLGLYCGLGHSELALASLTLLEKIASSRKLTNPGKRGDRSKLLGVLEQDDESSRISRSLSVSMAFDMREFEAGLESPGYRIKSTIIAFLKNSLAASPDRPCIAHLLIGFKINGSELYVDDSGPFAAGVSLIHSVARLALDYPDSDGQSYVAWAGNIKEACTEMLRLLWTSPVSASTALVALRSADYLFLQAMRQEAVGANTLWDGKTVSDPEFIMTDSAISLKNFLLQRRAHLDLFARELRFAKASGMTSVLLRLQSSLFGLTTFPGEDPVQNPNVFAMFDFMELDFSSEMAMPPLEYFKDEQFQVCKATDADNNEYFDLARAREVISLQRNIRTGSQVEPKEEHQKTLQLASNSKFEEESTIVLLILLGRNHWRELNVAHSGTLNAWIKLIVVIIETCSLEENLHSSFIQQAFQLVQPKFERAFREDLDSVLSFAALINTLMTGLYANGAKQDGAPSSGSNSNSDMEFQVFRTALNAITSTASSIPLREQCYQICYQYLRHAARDSAKKSVRRRNVVKNVRVVNDKLIDIICDDALTSDAKTRIAALLVLEALVAVFALDDPKFILGRFEKLNFVGVLVDVVKQIPTDLREAQPSGMLPLLASITNLADVALALGYHSSCLTLLLRIAQIRAGAISLFNSGIFSAIRHSEIFSTDPDIGFGKPHSLCLPI
jgi:nuclear pore complex protein Nup205